MPAVKPRPKAWRFVFRLESTGPWLTRLASKGVNWLFMDFPSGFDPHGKLCCVPRFLGVPTVAVPPGGSVVPVRDVGYPSTTASCCCPALKASAIANAARWLARAIAVLGADAARALELLCRLADGVGPSTMLSMLRMEHPNVDGAALRMAGLYLNALWRVVEPGVADVPAGHMTPLPSLMLYVVVGLAARHVANPAGWLVKWAGARAIEASRPVGEALKAAARQYANATELDSRAARELWGQHASLCLAINSGGLALDAGGGGGPNGRHEPSLPRP